VGVRQLDRGAGPVRQLDLAYPPAPSFAPASAVDAEPEVDAARSSRGYLMAMLATLFWYAVPISLYLLYASLLDHTARPNCRDVLGRPCGSQSQQAIGNLLDVTPRILLALALSIVLAMGIRWVATTWKTLTVGFAGAVVGGGLATVFFAVLAA
jgi:hypothetical protein